MTITDILICSTTFPVTASFLNQRRSTLFGSDIFCTLWGVVWDILPMFSVFLVTVLSITRTVIIFNQGRKINQKIVMLIIMMYAILLIIQPLLQLKISVYIFTEADLYCWNMTFSIFYKKLDIVLRSVQLAFPILPIIFSCIISTFFIISSIKLSKQKSPGNVIKQKVTITILIVTFVYIIFNIPVFINFVLHATLILHDNPYPDDIYYNNTVMFYYSWNITYVVCVALNSAVNPIIYFCRMKHFKASFIKLFKGKRRTSEYTSVAFTKNTEVSELQG